VKKRPDLPPRMRGRPARRLTSAAVLGRFELPVCTSCGHVQYPIGEICGRCLSDDLSWQPVARNGTVLATTVICHATEAYFQKNRPIRVGSIKLDIGPVVFARLGQDVLAAGQRVKLSNQLDRSGEAILCASAEETTKVENVLADPNREIEGRTVLVTGANGGIGRALVSAFLEAGATEVIAATRSGDAKEFSGAERVTQIALDITDAASVRRASETIGHRVDILVNNAGFTAISGFFEGSDTQGARREMEVNYFGTLEMLRAFAPHMKARRQGVIVNVLTVLAHSCLPSMGSYCASKAAALSLTQGVRAELIPWGVRVCAIFPSTVDTPASVDSPPPKLAPRRVAQEIIRMIRDGEEDCYPGDIARDLIAAIRKDAKTVEREMALALPEPD